MDKELKLSWYISNKPKNLQIDYIIVFLDQLCDQVRINVIFQSNTFFFDN